MQTLEIISINVGQILISLCNLVLLFLILKKFLFQPVKKVMKQRQDALDAQYDDAEQAKNEAHRMQREWEETLSSASAEADAILQRASLDADKRSEAILTETREKADRILRRAEADAKLERKKAEAEIKKEIVDVSAALSEKMLGREINTEDHRALIDSFIEELGDGDGGNG